MRTPFLFLSLTVSVVVISSVFAQTAFAALDLITLRTNPKTPAPNQPVTVVLESYAVNLNSAEIVWYVDGVAIKKGVALKSFETRTKDFGVAVVVDVVITTLDGARYDKTITLKPEEVDILWEADTYVPPFYKGKALPSYKSMVKVTALPRFNSLSSDPSSYVYRWTVNRTQGAGEGLGVNSTRVRAGWPDSRLPVSVDVTIPSSTEAGSASLSIPIANTQMLFYKRAPLLGVDFDHAVTQSYSERSGEAGVRAVPYFFSLENIGNEEILWRWSNNGIELPQKSRPFEVVLTKGVNAEEVNLLRVTAQNPKQVLQQSDSQIIVSFEE